MSSKKKDIGLGLIAGMGIGTLLIGGMWLVADFVPLSSIQPASAQEAVFAPEIMSTEIFTQAPFPTATTGAVSLSMQSTPIPPTPTVSTEMLIIGNPLNGEEQAQLHVAARAYISTDYYTIKANGERINGVGYGHPSNICGPLSIAILQDAQILSRNVIPYDF